jgi:hypothetical protein
LLSLMFFAPLCGTQPHLEMMQFISHVFLHHAPKTQGNNPANKYQFF